MAAKALKLTGNGRDLLGQLLKRRRLESRQLGDIRRDPPRLLLEPIHIAPDCDDDHKIQHHILDADHGNSLSCALSVTHHFLRLEFGLHAHDHALERSRGKYLPIVWRADLFSPRVHQQLGVGH